MKDKAKKLSKLCYFNRQPTLWRHGIAAVQIIPADDDEDLTIGLSPLMLEPYNADFDGDECTTYFIHDIDALEEMEEKAYIKNTFRYDSNNEMLSTVRHEILYACYILSENITPNFDKYKDNIITINELSELSESIEQWNDDLNQPVYFNNNYYTYGICLLNKWIEFDNIYINQQITKHQANDISEILYKIDPTNFYDTLTLFTKRLFFFISTTNHNPTIDVDEMVNVVPDETEKLFKSLPHNNPYLGYHINEALIDKCIANMDKKSNLYRLFLSGSRMNKQQLSRSCINVGYVADVENKVIHTPICTNLMKGLDKQDYFRASPGARKGIHAVLF